MENVSVFLSSGAKAISEFRKKHKLTQTEVAQLLKLSHKQQISDRERGIIPVIERDILIITLWELVLPMCQFAVDELAKGHLVINYEGDPDDLSGGIDAIDIAMEIAGGEKNIVEALEKAAKKTKASAIL